MRAAAALVACAALAGGCRGERPEAIRARAEEARLALQIRGLQELVEAAERGDLLRPGQVLIAVGESVLQDLLAASLPQEREVAGRFRVRLEKVSVQFRASRSLVELRGRVSAKALPGTFADLRLVGGLHRVEIHPGSGLLTGELMLDEFEVVRAAASGSQSDALETLIEELGRERVETFAELLPPFEIPIKVEQDLHIAGFGDGPISVAGGRLPLRLSVVRLMPLAGRLWVVLDAASGPWTAERLEDGR